MSRAGPLLPVLWVPTILAGFVAEGCAATAGTVSGDDRVQVPEAWLTSGGERRRRLASSLQPADRSSIIPGGITCRLRLQRLEVPHSEGRLQPGVLTPVQLHGEVGGVRWVRIGRPSAPLVCDCRLALTLHRAAPALRALGVERMLYSNSYRPPRGNARRVSRHAMGLAIDVHQVQVRGELYDVRRDFARGGGCIETTPLNAVSCALVELRLFDRVLTPDTDDDHQDHFHLAIVSLSRRRQPHRRRPEPVITD